MPRYDYHCPANRRIVETSHSMAVTLRTWGELCASAGIDKGTTPANSPVERVISPAMLLGARRGSGGAGGHSHGSCCGEAGCGG
ncbi:MAG: zinc ribbon domain-containing protein [bacterium]|jgi:hypothetical protein